MGGLNNFLKLVDGKGKSWLVCRLDSPPVGGPPVDRLCRAEFPREETEAHLPWALGLSPL